MTDGTGGSNALTLDIDILQSWLGKTEQTSDTINLPMCQRMAATIESEVRLKEGDVLPPLWHWLFFHANIPSSDLAEDGHAKLGGFLPPVDLPRRMWAGGRLRFFGGLCIGATINKHSEITSIVRKKGGSGELCFVTVKHTYFHQAERVLEEEHDIVYLEAKELADKPTIKLETERKNSIAAAALCSQISANTLEVTPSVSVLFRYSALTFNSHRIHYDRGYCQQVEGYEGLVFHGPLTATLMAGFAESYSGRKLKSFEFRALLPLFDTDAFTIETVVSGDGMNVIAKTPSGLEAMRASATF